MTVRQSSRPRVEIILVTWNGKEDTVRALDALMPQIEASPGASVIVVDNGSTDGTASEIKRRFGLVAVTLTRNAGFTGGVRAGCAAATAEWLVFLNNDAIPQPGWLDAYLRAADHADDDVIAFAGKIVDLTGTLIDFIGGFLTFDGHAFQNGFRKPLAAHPQPEPGAELLFACGGNMMVRRAVFLDLDGFDDDYFAYLEDVDFGWRAWLSGWRITYLPTALVKHRSSATSDRLGDFERGVLFERNALQTALKNYDSDVLPQVAGTIFLTLLHRIHRYVVDRNGETAELTRPPFGEGSSTQGPTRRSGWRRFFRRRRPPVATLSDDLTRMQFRAMEWFFENSERITEKRTRVQARRVRSDREIFERFPLYYVPTYPGDEPLMGSALFRILRSELPGVDIELADVIAT